MKPSRQNLHSSNFPTTKGYNRLKKWNKLSVLDSNANLPTGHSHWRNIHSATKAENHWHHTGNNPKVELISSVPVRAEVNGYLFVRLHVVKAHSDRSQFYVSVDEISHCRLLFTDPVLNWR
jgi:hypothetical protein